MKFSLGHLTSLIGTTTPAGLVIRAGAVELLSLKGKQLAARVSIPLEGKEPVHLSAAIQKACDTAGITTKKLAVSILTQDVLLRFFMIPVVPRAEWDAAVQFEARKYIPFKTAELVWDAHVAPSRTPGKLDVIFAAIKRETFAAIQTALTGAGIQPTLIEPQSASLARLTASGAGKPAGDFVCVVDVEEQAAHLSIVRDGVPYLARDISFSVARPQPDSTPTDAGVTDPRAQRLLSELAVSIDFFTREYASAGMTKIWLFGEESLIAPSCRWLADQLRCPVELGTPLLAQAVDGGLPLSFASAVGVLSAMRNRHGASLDFLKRVTRKPATPAARAAKVVPGVASLASSIKTPQAAVFVSVLAGLLLCVWGVGVGRMQAKRRQLQQLSRSTSPVGWGLDGMTPDALESLAAQIKPQLALLKQLLEQRVSVAAKLDALARTLPDGVWLTGLTYEDRGDAPESQQLRLLIKGACFLGDDRRELSTIQDLGDRIKRNALFLTGLGTSRLEEIGQESSPRTYAYRTFQLQCGSDEHH